MGCDSLGAFHDKLQGANRRQAGRAQLLKYRIGSSQSRRITRGDQTGTNFKETPLMQ